MPGKGLRFGLLLIALVATLLIARNASAEGEVVAAGSAIIDLDGEAAVSIIAQDIGPPGLGAWSIDISYDEDLAAAVGCDPQNGSVCNPAFAPDTVRVSGASANGIEGDVTLATISFRCVAEGMSALTVSINILADSTVGDPQTIEGATQNGGITCEDLPDPTATIAPPTTTATAAPPAPTSTPRAGGVPVAGGGPGLGRTDPLTWIIAAFAGAGLAWLSAAVAGVRLLGDGGGSAPLVPNPPTSPKVPPFEPAMRPRATPRRSRRLPTQRSLFPPRRPAWSLRARDRLDDIGAPRKHPDGDAPSDPKNGPWLL